MLGSAASTSFLELGWKCVILPALVKDLGDARYRRVSRPTKKFGWRDSNCETVRLIFGGVEFLICALGGHGWYLAR